MAKSPSVSVVPNGSFALAGGSEYIATAMGDELAFSSAIAGRDGDTFGPEERQPDIRAEPRLTRIYAPRDLAVMRSPM